MSPDGTIAVSRIWKRFRADRHTRTPGDQLRSAGRRLRRAHDGQWTWALRDVSLHAEPGDSVGLIGTNGSGKSTLLKILTRVMNPYAGSVAVSGRVGALIEVRAGIHPELTGYENIYLYGSLLGLSRRQVAERFDDIVDFAQLELAIDRQVKFYSSGMYMRLGFAVAAFLEPTILLVDEVLAVGDASFQQRCLDRMRHVLAQGTTLVLVSHDLAAVEATCSRALWLDQGEVRAEGEVRHVLGSYRQAVEEAAELPQPEDGTLRLLKTEITTSHGGMASTGQPLNLRLVIESPEQMNGKICVGISEGTPSPIFLLKRPTPLVAGQTEARITLRTLPLPAGRYYLWVGVFANNRDLLGWHPAAHFDIAGPELTAAPRGIVRQAPIHIDAEWTIDRV